ncbi:unnamed protein product [Vicia faba]|uniref:Uncharacterized protein n=1 Tax=Vicia faba TaxID=3906 RepID=A0AAV0ZVI9_VICFA|nr:unnamed protein product [Vicia faba]
MLFGFYPSEGITLAISGYNRFFFLNSYAHAEKVINVERIPSKKKVQMSWISGVKEGFKVQRIANYFVIVPLLSPSRLRTLISSQLLRPSPPVSPTNAPAYTVSAHILPPPSPHRSAVSSQIRRRLHEDEGVSPAVTLSPSLPSSKPPPPSNYDSGTKFSILFNFIVYL